MPEWVEIASKLTLDGALLAAVVMLWRKTEAQGQKIEALNEARIGDLKAMLKQSD